MDLPMDSPGAKLFEAFKQLQGHATCLKPDCELRPSEFFTLRGLQLCIQEQEQKTGKAPPGVTMSALSRFTHRSLPAASQVVSSLEEQGLVTRVMPKTDRRVVYVNVTPAGEALINEVGVSFHKMLNAITDRLGEADTQQLIALLHRLGEILGEMRQTPSCPPKT